jgi:hypothetical protein
MSDSSQNCVIEHCHKARIMYSAYCSAEHADHDFEGKAASARGLFKYCGYTGPPFPRCLMRIDEKLQNTDDRNGLVLLNGDVISVPLKEASYSFRKATRSRQTNLDFFLQTKDSDL